MEPLTPQEKADAFNRFMQERGISRALTPQEEVEALNAAVQQTSGAPAPQPEPGFLKMGATLDQFMQHRQFWKV